MERGRYSETYYQRNKEKLIESQKEYKQIPEVKERIKAYRKEHRKKNKEKIRKRAREYYQRNKEKIKERVIKYEKKRSHEDYPFNLKLRLRRRLAHAFKDYSDKGKIKQSKKYGINYKKIIEHLKPFPKDIKNYHVDHIMPLSYFDFNNPQEIKWAFEPINHQWLRKKLNHWKSDKFILAITLKEQEKLLKQLNL